MTSIARPYLANLPSPRNSATALAVSAAAALIVGVLTLSQGTPTITSAPALHSAVSALPSDAVEPLDAGVDWSRVELAPEPDGASVAAYER